MTKKTYIQPTMLAVKLQHKSQILTGSKDIYGMNTDLGEDVVDVSWVKGSSTIWDEEW